MPPALELPAKAQIDLKVNADLQSIITLAIKEANMEAMNGTLSLPLRSDIGLNLQVETKHANGIFSRLISPQIKLKYKYLSADRSQLSRSIILVQSFQKSQELAAHVDISVHEICMTGEVFLVYQRKSLIVDYDISSLSSQCNVENRLPVAVEIADDVKALRRPPQIDFHSNQSIHLLIEQFAYSSSETIILMMDVAILLRHPSFIVQKHVKESNHLSQTFIQLTLRFPEHFETSMFALFSYTTRAIVLRLRHFSLKVNIPETYVQWPFTPEGSLSARFSANAIVPKALYYHEHASNNEAMLSFLNKQRILNNMILSVARQQIDGEGIVRISPYHFESLRRPRTFSFFDLNYVLKAFTEGKMLLKFQTIHTFPRNRKQKQVVETRRWVILYKRDYSGLKKLVAAVCLRDVIILEEKNCSSMDQDDSTMTYPWPFTRTGSRIPQFVDNPIAKSLAWIKQHSVLYQDIEALLDYSNSGRQTT